MQMVVVKMDNFFEANRLVECKEILKIQGEKILLSSNKECDIITNGFFFQSAFKIDGML